MCHHTIIEVHVSLLLCCHISVPLQNMDISNRSSLVEVYRRIALSLYFYISTMMISHLSQSEGLSCILIHCTSKSSQPTNKLETRSMMESTQSFTIIAQLSYSYRLVYHMVQDRCPRPTPLSPFSHTGGN